MADAYYSRPEWSYSSMKLILDHGIDYAVAAKRGDLPDLDSKAIDLGQLVHMLALSAHLKTSTRKNPRRGVTSRKPPANTLSL